ncbi:MAG: putative metallo-hydrolase YflN [Anaerolineae bacterium]|nr:putative metallo-hydrolase YflN [Anaerolineae bacterium]
MLYSSTIFDMPFQQIFPGVYEFANGIVNNWLIADDDGWTLIDTGYPNKEQTILDALAAFGKKPNDIKRILLTHAHPDHVGGYAALKQVTGAPAWIHPLDAQVVRGAIPLPRVTPSPGLLPWLLFNALNRQMPNAIPRAEIENEIADGERLPIGGGLRVIHTPGHSAGHCAFLLERDGNLLFAADACANVLGLGPSIVYADHAQGRASLRKLAALNFDTVCFGHGKALHGANAKKFNAKWK